ncbi:MAG: hypothetical protein F4Y95_11480 [Chloroflexi bacterium]|nr:hypothetical protein [Chloroflexota bacterium]
MRPVILRAKPVNAIVGNPPWITYNKTQAVVREELERQSKERYQIWDGGRYATQQDIAGMFFARCVELYLEPGGRAGMVLPHSALQTGQYRKWRAGKWGVLSVDLGVRRPWDLDRIEPNDFFPVPSCVAFLTRKDPPGKPLPRQADSWRGNHGGPFTKEPVQLTDTSGEYASPYGERARNGATIYPRPLFFVNEEASTALVQAANTVSVSPRRSAQEKSPWKELELPDLVGSVIEADHVYDIHLGETVAPYMLLQPLRAVLPLSKSTGQLVKSEDGWYDVDPLSLGERMRRRWRVTNELWDDNKGTNNELSLLENVDYMRKLSAQNMRFDAKSGVLYGASGQPTAVAYAQLNAVVDHSLFWLETESLDEARYLVTTINSQKLSNLLKPLMPKGQFGARHVHKHLWRLPIPEYDDSDSLHVEIAQAGEDAAAGAKVLWDEIRAEREDKGQSTSVTVARREIRKWLSESSEGQRVEELVGRLLGG